MRTRILVLILLGIVVVESALLAMPYLSHLVLYRAPTLTGESQHISFPYGIFNRPITNDTEHEVDPAFTGSWQAELQSTLVPMSKNAVTEAEVAFAPSSSTENNAIPAIIVQERADGLVRVEYFAQNWPKTFGLLLYNSTTPGWQTSGNFTLRFTSNGPPSEVNPELAPKPNGLLSIMLGRTTVVSDYPIAWANLSDLYLYGYPGSAFVAGSIDLNISAVSSS